LAIGNKQAVSATSGSEITAQRMKPAAVTLKSALTMMQAGASMDEVIARFAHQEEATV